MNSKNIKDLFPELWPMLLYARVRNKLSHAYLAVGDDTSTLEQFGHLWSKICACQQPQLKGGEPCYQCNVCLRIENDSYHELYKLQPASKSRQITVDEVRNCEHQLNLATESGHHKIALIYEADRMTTQAQNAFLKTLEEPPPNVTLILLSTQPKSLLPTIRSRCQTISLLTNKRTYSETICQQIVPAIAKLKPDAGSATALSVAATLKNNLAALHAQAQEQASVDEGLQQYEQELTKGAQKELEELRTARVQAEYLRLRQTVTEMIQTWFQQKELLAYGITRNDLPNPEMLDYSDEDAESLTPEADEAKRQTDIVSIFIQCLNDNVEETLAVESFCLDLCKRRNARRQ